MGLALDPWIRNRERRSPETREDRSPFGRERPVRIVHGDLSDRHGIRSVVEYRHGNTGAAQHGALDRETLDRRRAFALELLRGPGSNDQQDQPGEKEEWKNGGDPECSRGTDPFGDVTCHGVLRWPRRLPSTRAPRTRSGVRGT